MGSKFVGDTATIRALDAFIALSRAYNSFCARTNKHFETAKIGITEFAVLEALHHLGPLAQNVIAQKILCSKANLTLTIDKLEQRGFVTRCRQSDDRRCIHVQLTADGERFISELFPKHAEILKREMSVLNVEEQSQLKSICKKLGIGFIK